MRGLKLKHGLARLIWTRRIFYRCVDWNVFSQSRTVFENVASFTDAWIETTVANRTAAILKSHLLQMRGLKQIRFNNVTSNFKSHLLQMRGLKPISRVVVPRLECRIFYRCVDWNTSCLWLAPVTWSRIFYRCVDWNRYLSLMQIVSIVASFTDAWIETNQNVKFKNTVWVASFTDAWIETHQ